MKKTTITLNDLAALCNLTPRYLRQLSERGIIPRVTRSRIERDGALRGLFAHYQKIPETMAAERLALTKANRELKEHELALATGGWMRIDVADRTLLSALTMYHALTRRLVETYGPLERKAKLADLGVDIGVQALFHEYDIAASIAVIDRLENERVNLGKDSTETGVENEKQN